MQANELLMTRGWIPERNFTWRDPKDSSELLSTNEAVGVQALRDAERLDAAEGELAAVRTELASTEEERAMLFDEQTAAYAAFGYEDYEGENSVADMILNQQSAQAEGLIELLNKVKDQNAKLEAQVTALTAQAEWQRVALKRLLDACTTDCGMLEKAGAVEEARAALTGQGDGNGQ